MSRLPYFTVLALFIVVGFLSGCQEGSISGGYVDPALVVPTEKIPSEDVYVAEAAAHIDGQITRVVGRVKRALNNCCHNATGHVDIVVVADDGIVLDAISVLFSPRNISKTGKMSAKFKADLPYAVPEGTVIRLRYHDSLHAVDKDAYAGSLFHCEQNMAVPEEHTAVVLP
ncbi:MAG: hypothetical protein KAJ07_05360 [Planctomycetes bacterium]|nr:hypothetical protein [Planctomycetota bacterium]MCK5564653.1 hypothetical protein [Planctomycetota bacterium]